MIVNPTAARKYLIVILISAFASVAFSQQKSNYSLLWKITGKGLNKPSYLFATMHVKDKRVFNFSDSVMLSLQSCQRFAMEVHPDTLMIKMFASLQNKDSLRNIDKLLGKADYERLAKKFKDKNGYDIGKTDPMIIESLMEPKDTKPDDKVSFIDAYLYGIARTLNKGVLGLEDASSQFDQYYGSKEAVKERLLDLLDDDAAEAMDEGRERMIKIYSSGNLDDIYTYVLSTGMNDSTIVARNKVMAASMIKYMADGTLFTAVGAAHLPGPDGVIALLTKEGYTVTRVKAEFTGVANKYHIDYMKMDWPAYRDEGAGYSVNFPGTPLKYPVGDINTVIYPDMANDAYYGIYAVPRGTREKPANREVVIGRVISNMKLGPKNQVMSRRDFMFNKILCTEILVKAPTGYSRMRVLIKNDIMYVFYAGAKLNRLNLPYINRFLNSFVSLPVVKRAPVTWIDYNNTAGAFTAKMPGQPKDMSQQVPTKSLGKNITMNLNMYISTDTLNSAAYLVRYNDYPPATFLSDKEALFSRLTTEFADKGKITAGPVKIEKDGYEGRELSAVLKGGYHAKVRVYVRGNRVYLLLSEILLPDINDDGNDVFFNSFHFTPYAGAPYYALHPDSSNYTVQIPASPFFRPDSTGAADYTNYLKNVKTWYATNPNSGGLFGFEHSTLSPYYRAKNVDSVYSKLVKQLVNYQDTTLKIDTVTVDGIKGRELLVKKKTGDGKRRIRVLIKDADLFCFISRVDTCELFDKTTNTFYNSLVVTPSNSEKIDLSASKAAKILQDLNSADTTVHKNALGALSYYDFEAGELPAIYSALQKSYPDDTLLYGARGKLIMHLPVLNNDSTINVLVNLYGTLKDKDVLKASILNVMPRINVKTGYVIYLKLLTTDPPANTKNGYMVFGGLTDSIEFAAEHFKQILPLVKNESYRTQVLWLAKRIADKDDANYNKMLKENYPAIMAYAQTDITNYLRLRDSTDSKWSNIISAYLQLMPKVKNGINDKLTKDYIEKDPKGLYISDAVIARVYNNLPNNSVLVNRLLDTISTRYDLMKAFNSQNQLAKVPLKYRTPEAFAKLCLYQFALGDDYGTPEKMTLLGTIMKKGSVYYVFKFLLPDSEDKKETIGLAGPFKPGATKLNFDKYYGYTEYQDVKSSWRLQANKLIQSMAEISK